MNEIELSEGFFLSGVQHRDKEALVEHLQSREISRNTLDIPYPYSESDAETWIEMRREHRKQEPKEVTFAIRNPEETLIGVVGAGNFEVGSSHRANVGYWLAKPYWNRGIMTEAVDRYAQYAFAELGVVRLTAEVFAENVASARVLEKVGFTQEGHLRNHRENEGDLVDVLYFGLLEDEFTTTPAR